MDDAVEHAKENGYVTTVFGRRRPVPGVIFQQFYAAFVRGTCRYECSDSGNSNLQNIMKIAMNGVNRRLKENNMKSKLVLQVHDELLIEAYEEELEDVKEILSHEMVHAAKLHVPLEVDMHTGKNWYEAK